MPTIVIYDPERQIAALANEESGRTLGPMLAGEGSQAIMQGFLASFPYDFAVLDSYQLGKFFEEFLSVVNEPDEAATEPGAVTEDVTFPAASVPPEPALAGVAVDNTNPPPPPQPADADEGANGAPVVQRIQCVNCNGQGSITWGDSSEPQQCPMCKGSGSLLEKVA